MALAIGKPAPDFTLLDQDGKEQRLSAQLGGWLLLYFYPKDDTPGCTTEACGFRDNLPKFKKQGVTVWGISTDTVKSHQKFIKNSNNFKTVVFINTQSNRLK